MRQSVADDLEDSAKIFGNLVWPKIKDWLGGGELIPVEAVVNKEMSRKLDNLAGIDAWHMKNNEGIRGIASRIQWPPKDSKNLGKYPYNSFTVRKERESGARTEYEKREEAIGGSKGWLFPEVTVQAYVDKKDKLLSIGAIKTKQLIQYIDGHHVKTKPSYDRQSGERAMFYIIYWKNLKEIKVWP